MFKENFIRLCNEKNESPSSVCRKVNITAATFSGWNENSVPRTATLMRIADYFGVPVESLTADKEKEKALVFNESFTESEKKIILAYRNHPEMHEAIHRILGIEETSKEDSISLHKVENPSQSATIAAKGNAELQIGKKAPKTSDNL